MSSVGLHIETSEFPVPETNREKFFRLLLHDDRNSIYFISTIKDGVWTDTPVRGRHLSAYHFVPGRNYYVTHNGFTKKRRLAENARQINSLFLDVDCHRASSQAERDLAIDAILDRLGEAVLAELFPMPTLIVNTGRGVQLYYVLKRSIPCQLPNANLATNPGTAYFEDVQRRLADKLAELMSDIELVDIDRCVFDWSRVGRVPDTFNTKAGRSAKLVNAFEVYYDLAFLAQFCPIPAKTGPEALSNQNAPKASSRLRFNALMIKRLQNIYDLQAYRNYDCHGSRELMSFVFYNTAVQVYERQRAVDLLTAFNAKFSQPLPKIELAGITTSVNRVTNVKGAKGYYVLSANTIRSFLSLTEQEVQALGFFSSKRAKERADAKLATKEKREARNSKIIDLYKSGQLTQQQVADAAGCSVRTVHSVLKEAGLTKSMATESVNLEVKHNNGVEPEQPKHSNDNTTKAEQLSNEPAKYWQPCLGGSALFTLCFGNSALSSLVGSFPQQTGWYLWKTPVWTNASPLPRLRFSAWGGGPSGFIDDGWTALFPARFALARDPLLAALLPLVFCNRPVLDFAPPF